MSDATSKKEFIDRIRQMAGFHEKSAMQEAIEAVKSHPNEKTMKSAKERLLLDHDRKLMAELIIQALETYWPK